MNKTKAKRLIFGLSGSLLVLIACYAAVVGRTRASYTGYYIAAKTDPNAGGGGGDTDLHVGFTSDTLTASFTMVGAEKYIFCGEVLNEEDENIVVDIFMDFEGSYGSGYSGPNDIFEDYAIFVNGVHTAGNPTAFPKNYVSTVCAELTCKLYHPAVNLSFALSFSVIQ